MRTSRNRCATLQVEVELGFDDQLAVQARPSAASTAMCKLSSPITLCIECDACMDICPVDCINFTMNDEPRSGCAQQLRVPATDHRGQDLYVSETLKTGRIMVKDEDVCLHCGLCAERCPTGAWDMQKYFYAQAQAAPVPATRNSAYAYVRCNRRRGESMSGINDFVLSLQPSTDPGRPAPTRCLPKRLFRMGIPVSPKNIFPRIFKVCRPGTKCGSRKKAISARRDGVDLMVAMNPQSYRDDLNEVVSGGYFFLRFNSMPRIWPRDDITILGMPIAKMCAQKWSDPRQRQLFKNMVYVGALSALLDMDDEALEGVVSDQFKGKEKLIGANMEAIELGRNYAQENFACPLPIKVRPANATEGKIMVSGNDAAGLGAVYAGATVCAWYPITPSTSLAEAYRALCQEVSRIDEDGNKQPWHRAGRR